MRHADREYANEASFVTDRHWRNSLTLAVLESREISGIALSSDGLRLVACSDVRTGTPFEPFFEDLFKAAESGVSEEQLARFLESVDDRTGDDKSLLVAVRG